MARHRTPRKSSLYRGVRELDSPPVNTVILDELDERVPAGEEGKMLMTRGQLLANIAAAIGDHHQAPGVPAGIGSREPLVRIRPETMHRAGAAEYVTRPEFGNLPVAVRE